MLQDLLKTHPLAPTVTNNTNQSIRSDYAIKSMSSTNKKKSPALKSHSVQVFQNDLPEDLELIGDLAVDTETLGLNLLRDRLCLVQIADAQGKIVCVQFRNARPQVYEAPKLKALLEDPKRTKIFHYARFDVAALQHYLGAQTQSVFCTKIGSYLCRTYTNHHGLKALVREYLGIELSKYQQSSNWAADELTLEQLNYAASDVAYLHRLRDKLVLRLEERGLSKEAQGLFDFIPLRAHLDLLGWDNQDLFSHSIDS